MSNEAKLNIYQRINNVRKSIGYVQKDKTVSTGQGSYKAVTHDQVTAMVRAPMIEQGIVCVPTLIEGTYNLPVVDTDGRTSRQRLYEATYEFAFINADNPEDRVVVRIQSHAMDSGDKAPGKALSYAKKYAVLKLFELETGEDDESRVADRSLDEELLANLISAINNAQSIEDLRSAYESAYAAADRAKDTEALRVIVRSKNARYRQLQGSA